MVFSIFRHVRPFAEGQGAYTGWPPIAPILSVLVALLIRRGAWKLFEHTLLLLLEGASGNAGCSGISARPGKAVPGIQT